MQRVRAGARPAGPAVVPAHRPPRGRRVAASPPGDRPPPPPPTITVPSDPVSPRPAGDPPALAAALAAASAAAAAAEAGLDKIPTLPSARERGAAWPPAALAAARLLRALAIGAGVLACQPAGLTARSAAGLAVAAAAGARGLRSRSLSASGAAAAALLGGAALASSFRLGALVLGFYAAGSAVTRLGEDRKAAADADHKPGGQRDGWQVAAAAAVPAALGVAAAALCAAAGGPPSADFLPASGAVTAAPARAGAAVAAAFGYVSACAGDTFSSELGALSDATPRLVTSGRQVRRGTNGGVTAAGLAGAVLGGGVAGACFWTGSVLAAGVAGGRPAAAHAASSLAALSFGGGAALGLGGSLLDSVLGATLQFSGVDRAGGAGKVTSRPGPTVVRIAGYPLLSNAAVNAVSSCAAAVVGAAWLGARLV